ncbi:MAG TPA: methionine--tRNA ligase subunit beta [Candidatus Bathyarchaeia archaeon]|nr:methionine--tRNA ligase subunit beta [Candidatus Bathyarchaeia archaeon]
MLEKIVSFEEFTKMDLRIGKITKAEPVAGSRNLIKMLIDVGNDDIRQAVAGLAQYYNAKELEGKHVAVIANLQPKKMFGIESNVMILAAEDENTVSMLMPDRPVTTGSRIK